jgi:hypothetical protein
MLPETEYIFRGDKLTDPRYRGGRCRAVRRSDGRCIRGKNGNMLVCFVDLPDSPQVNLPARQLRKVIPG